MRSLGTDLLSVVGAIGIIIALSSSHHHGGGQRGWWWCAAQEVTTIAGQAAYSYLDGTGTAAKFSNPQGIAVNLAGTHLYVCDTYNHVIRSVSLSDRSVATVAGSAGTSGIADGVGSAARFSQPVGIAINRSNIAFIVDQGSSTIRVLTIATTAVILVAGNAGTGLGMTGSADGTGTSATFYYPAGIALSADGTFAYIADDRNGKVRRMSIPGYVVVTLSGTGAYASTDGSSTTAAFGTPMGVALDAYGNIVVSDSALKVIRNVSTDGTATTLRTTANLTRPRGIVYDASTQHLYFADSGTSVIRRIDANGTVTTHAGTVGRSATADGVGTAASFQDPAWIAIHGGYLYVTEGTGTIRRVTTAIIAPNTTTTTTSTTAIAATSTTATTTVSTTSSTTAPTNASLTTTAAPSATSAAGMSAAAAAVVAVVVLLL